MRGKEFAWINEADVCIVRQNLATFILYFYVISMLSDEQIQHIAKLARLGLKKGEPEKFSRQLSEILSYVDQLKEVETDNVDPTLQVTGLQNVTRKDEVFRFSSREELLACTPLPVVRDQIKVQSVINS